MNNYLDVYKEKKILVTGHTGFKGSWLVFLLHDLGADVTGFSLKTDSDRSHYSLLNMDAKINSIIGDIRNKDHLESVFEDTKPEIVFHLAAQSLVRLSYDNPVETIDTNVIGSTNLLESVHNCDSVRSLVYITSDKCYENLEWIWGYRENDKLGGHDPYSASKAAAEIIFSTYSNSFYKDRENFGSASVRAGNVIGGGDWAVDRIVPDCIRAIQNNNKIKLRNPEATRPWQHVLEPLSGYLKLASKLYSMQSEYSGSWNFGPLSYETRTVKTVAKMLISRIGEGEITSDSSAKHPHEANLLQLNCDKAHQLLDWHPKWGVDKSIIMTADWYKRYLSGEPVEDITRDQIKEYFKGVI